MADPTGSRIPSEIHPDFYRKSLGYAHLNVWLPLILLFFAFSLGRSVTSPWKSALLVLIVGSLQYRLYFPLHECAHANLFSSRAENTWWGRILGGLLFTPFAGFRDEHLKHHRIYGTREDSGAIDYWVRFDSRRKMALFFLAPLWGGTILGKLRDNYGVSKRPDKSGKITVALAHLLFPAGMQMLVFLALVPNATDPGQWWRYFVFAPLPAVTVFLFMSRLRMFMEHGSLDYAEFDYLSNPKVTARTIPSFFPERTFFCGMNFNYHHEHHLYPQVPSCNLPRLSQTLTFAKLEPREYHPSYFSGLFRLWRSLR